MSDRKPIVIAVSVGAVAVAANGAAAIIAVSAAAPPPAVVFGIAGLTAAFVGLIATLLWAWRDEVALPERPRGRVFTPWVPPQDDTEAYFLPQPTRAGQSLALAAPAALLDVAPTPMPVPKPAPAAAEGRVIYLEDWLKAHRAPRVHA